MTITKDVIEAAQLANKNWGIPASVTIAQYGLESGWGHSMPNNSNNPFGIKAVDDQPYVLASTREFVHGRYVRIIAKFRKFNSLAAAFDAHAQLLTHIQYAQARARLPDVEGFVKGIAGVYATDPHYADELMNIINSDKLQQYDQV